MDSPLKTDNFTATEWKLIERCAPCLVFDSNEIFYPKRIGVSLIRDTTFPPSLIRYMQESPRYIRFLYLVQFFGLTFVYGTPPWIYEIVRDRFQPVLMTFRHGWTRNRAALVIEYAIYYDSDIQHIYDLEHVWIYLDHHYQIIGVKASRHGMFVTQYETVKEIKTKNGHPILYIDPGKHAHHVTPKTMRKKILYACNTQQLSAQGMYPVHFFTPAIWQQFKDVYPGKAKIIQYYKENFAHPPSFHFKKYLIPERPLLVGWKALENEIPQRVYQFLKRIKQAKLKEIPKPIKKDSMKAFITKYFH